MELFGITTIGLEYGNVECWISPAARCWLRVAFSSLAKIEVMRWGREVTGALASGTEISKGMKEPHTKSVFEVDNASGNSQSTSPSCYMAGGVQPGSCKSNEISRGCGGRRARTRKTKSVGLGSTVPEAPAMATSWPRLPHLCQANFYR